MKNGIRLWAVVVLSCILGAGCTSIRTRHDILEEDWKIYPGVQQDVIEIGDAFSGKPQGPGWTKAIVVPILLFDLPFSAVFDTIVAPYDLYRVYDPKAFAKSR